MSIENTLETVVSDIANHEAELKLVTGILGPVIKDIACMVACGGVTVDDVKAIAKGAMLSAARIQMEREQNALPASAQADPGDDDDTGAA